jgi:tmRNA-binding protein
VGFAVERLTVAICKARFLLRTHTHARARERKKEREREKKRKNFLHRREIRTLGEIDKKSTNNVVCLCLFYVMANAGSSHFELTRIF